MKQFCLLSVEGINETDSLYTAISSLVAFVFLLHETASSWCDHARLTGRKNQITN